MLRLQVICIFFAVCFVVSECRWRRSFDNDCDAGCVKTWCRFSTGCQKCVSGYCLRYVKILGNNRGLCTKTCPSGQFCNSEGYCRTKRGFRSD